MSDAIFMLNMMIILPRQARDKTKHREESSTQNERDVRDVSHLLMRRVETALNHTWKQSHVLARGRGSSFRTVYTSARFHGDIQLCNQLRIRMLHFVQNLQYYLSAEVLGNPFI